MLNVNIFVARVIYSSVLCGCYILFYILSCDFCKQLCLLFASKRFTGLSFDNK